MTGMILDGVLMALLVAALGYGLRLEKKLSALRAGQQAFASAVTELNAAAGRAEAALASLRASGQETDLLHDRIVKAREVKAQLETLITRGSTVLPPPSGEGRPATAGPGGEVHNPTDRARLRTSPPGLGSASPPLPMKGRETTALSSDDGRAQRMAALADRIQGLAAPARPTQGRADVAAIVQAMTANQSPKQNLNRPRRNIDEDLFAA